MEGKRITKFFSGIQEGELGVPSAPETTEICNMSHASHWQPIYSRNYNLC